MGIIMRYSFIGKKIHTILCGMEGTAYCSGRAKKYRTFIIGFCDVILGLTSILQTGLGQILFKLLTSKYERRIFLPGFTRGRISQSPAPSSDPADERR